MANELSFLGGNEPSEPEVAPVAEPEAQTPEPQGEQTPPAEPTAPQERPRAPDGKFAPATPPQTPPAPPAAETPPAAPLTEKETVGFYKAMQEERDRRQAAEKRAAELEKRVTAQSPPTEPLPLEAQVQQALYKANLDNSRKWAVKEYGKEAVDKAFEWANARCEPTSPDFDPAFNSKIAASGDPYETAVQAYNREQLLAEAGDVDLAAFRAWKAAQGQPPAPADPSPPPSQPAPPRSLATASGTGSLGKGAVPAGEGEAFAALPFNN